MPVMWDSCISGLDQVGSFSSISTTPVSPVVNQQSQLKGENCSAPFLWQDKWEGDSCVWVLLLIHCSGSSQTCPFLWNYIHVEALAGAGFGLESSPHSKQES